MIEYDWFIYAMGAVSLMLACASMALAVMNGQVTFEYFKRDRIGGAVMHGCLTIALLFAFYLNVEAVIFVFFIGG